MVAALDCGLRSPTVSKCACDFDTENEVKVQMFRNCNWHCSVSLSRANLCSLARFTHLTALVFRPAYQGPLSSIITDRLMNNIVKLLSNNARKPLIRIRWRFIFPTIFPRYSPKTTCLWWQVLAHHFIPTTFSLKWLPNGGTTQKWDRKSVV